MGGHSDMHGDVDGIEPESEISDGGALSAELALELSDSAEGECAGCS